MKKSYKQKRQEGFTIIEVLIVLAIAALILLIVFLAVPALQRNSRNTQRKADISASLAAITEFESNNNGVVPLVACAVAGSPGAYAFSTGTCATPTGTAAQFKFGFYTVAPTVQITAVSPAPTTDKLTIATGNKCVAATPGTTTTVGAAARSIAAAALTRSVR